MEYDESTSAEITCPCGDATAADVKDFNEVKFWLEAVAVPTIGAIGLICNLVAIPILLAK